MAKKILVIDDDANLQELYKRAFAQKGYAIYTANTGEKGIRLANEKKPDLILLDIMLLGGINGFDVLEALKKSTALKEIPVVILSNLDTERNTAMEIGATDYIVKYDTDIDNVIAVTEKHLS
jgi:two-component system, OmpR family, alkaline phosphatase synthesis response regulator PhoP